MRGSFKELVEAFENFGLQPKKLEPTHECRKCRLKKPDDRIKVNCPICGDLMRLLSNAA